MRVYWGIVLLIGLLATGCAKQQIALTPENANKVASTTVMLVVAQEELEAKVEDSNIAGAMGGGLLPALIDVAIENSRSKSAEELVSPLRAHLSDVDFREELASELKDQLNNSWLHIEKVETTSALTKNERTHIIKDRPDNAILLIDAEYKLSPDFILLNTSASDELYLKDVKNPIYKNKIVISSDSVPAKSKEDAAAEWNQNSGDKLKTAIHDGIKRLAKAIALKLTPPVKAFAEDGAHSAVN